MTTTKIRKQRTYPAPSQFESTLLGPNPTIDDIDLLIESGAGTSEEREWAIKVRDRYVSNRLDKLLGEDHKIPRGIVMVDDDVDIVVGLERDFDEWVDGEWVPQDLDVLTDTIELTPEEVVFTADALAAGASGLALFAYTPLARIDRAIVAARRAPLPRQPPKPKPKKKVVKVDPIEALPAGAKTVAIVDEDDRNAVLELLAIAPGPHVFRRSNGEWYPDDGWLFKLKSIKPPPVVTLDKDPDLLKGIVSQVDEATLDDVFEPFTASVSGPWEYRAAEMHLAWTLAGAEPITAAKKSAGGASAMPLQLQKYWLAGMGAAKIRWGTPGAMRRCHRQLMKYVGPHAWQVCNNLGKKLGGKGVAWDVHVGSIQAASGRITRGGQPKLRRPIRPVRRATDPVKDPAGAAAAESAYEAATKKYYADLDRYNNDVIAQRKDRATLSKAVAANRKKEAANRKILSKALAANRAKESAARKTKSAADRARRAAESANRAKLKAAQRPSGGGRSRSSGGGGGGGGGRSSGGGGSKYSSLNPEYPEGTEPGSDNYKGPLPPWDPNANGGRGRRQWASEAQRQAAWDSYERSHPDGGAARKKDASLRKQGGGGSGKGGGGKGKGRGGGGGEKTTRQKIADKGGDPNAKTSWGTDLYKKEEGDEGYVSRAQPGWNESLYARDEYGKFTFKNADGSAKDGLEEGDGGEDVKELQEKLKKAGYDVGKPGADGKLGKLTKAAIKSYQRKNKLKEDGVAGNETFQKLDKTSSFRKKKKKR